MTFSSVSGFYAHPAEAVSTRCLQMLPRVLAVEEGAQMTPS